MRCWTYKLEWRLVLGWCTLGFALVGVLHGAASCAFMVLRLCRVGAHWVCSGGCPPWCLTELSCFCTLVNAGVLDLSVKCEDSEVLAATVQLSVCMLLAFGGVMAWWWVAAGAWVGCCNKEYQEKVTPRQTKP